MTYFVYLIGNYKKSKLTTYVGYTNNLLKRISLHNASKGAKFTKGKKWKLIYYESYTSKKIAMKKEYALKKNYKLRNKIKKESRNH